MGIFSRLFGSGEKQDLPEKPAQDPPVQTSELMDDDRFWTLIEQTRVARTYEDQQEMLGELLGMLAPVEIMKFDNRFRFYKGEAMTWELWAAAYIMNGGCSDDCFSDFRDWLISRGKKIYYDCLANQNEVIYLDHDPAVDEWEGFGYVVMEAYESKTGQRMPEGFRENHEIRGKEWEESQLPQKFSVIWNKWMA